MLLASRFADDSARSPLGNGMPIAKPSGTSSKRADRQLRRERQPDHRLQQVRQREDVNQQRDHDERQRQQQPASAR